METCDRERDKEPGATQRRDAGLKLLTDIHHPLLTLLSDALLCVCVCGHGARQYDRCTLYTVAPEGKNRCCEGLPFKVHIFD